MTTTDNSTFTFTPPFTFSPTSISSNWSGYVAMSNLGSPQTNSVSAVGGSWTVPTVTGPSSGLAYSSTWVGIDGFGGSTVEQVGTEQSVFNGSPVYRAWWEMYSTGDQQPEQVIAGMAISPGDLISASVQYITSGAHAGQFLLSIVDNSRTNDSFSTYQWASQTQNPQPQRNCAEWIMEAPSSIGGGMLPLADFSTVGFSNTWTTINGVTGPIYDPSWQSERVVMGTGGVTETSPSVLGSSPGTSFTVSFITSVGAGASTAQATKAPNSIKEYRIPSAAYYGAGSESVH